MTATPTDLAAWLEIERARVPDFAPRSNIAPTDPMVVVRLAEDGAREAAVVRWGLVPHWADDVREGSKHFNARSETVATKPAFRDAFHKRRCVVVVDSFYEWKAEAAPPGSRAKKPVKVPHRIGAAPGPGGARELLPMAGLWERWTSREGERVESCAVITTDAKGSVASLHDRMPVVLSRDDVRRWLDPRATDAELEEILGHGRDDFALERLEKMPVDAVRDRPGQPDQAGAPPQLSLFRQ